VRADSFFRALAPYIASVLVINAVAVANPPWSALFIALVFPVTYAYLMAAISYGILRHQLFDIELKLKFTLSRGAVAAMFLAVFFAVSLASSEFLVDRFDYVLGAAAAASLLIALQPLQRLGDRLADAAMPDVAATPEYMRTRKVAVYRAAFEAVGPGGLTERERDMLAALADSLGLSFADVRTIEKPA
jgi:amino acid transporter